LEGLDVLWALARRCSDIIATLVLVVEHYALHLGAPLDRLARLCLVLGAEIFGVPLVCPSLDRLLYTMFPTVKFMTWSEDPNPTP
jgi:hypothetical protein